MSEFQRCSERIPPRPPGATHRIIHGLYLSLDPLPGAPLGSSSALCIPLDRHGMPSGKGTNGRPRAPKRRTIDLRVGDQVLCSGRWRRIRDVRAYRSNWLTELQAAEGRGEGYVYRAPAG